MEKQIDIEAEFGAHEKKRIRPGITARSFNCVVIGPRSHAVHERI